MSQFITAQLNYPSDSFSSPLDIPIVLAGTFGELRSNHFHSGVDIKTQQREGLPVYAIGDGYISRIKIQHYGFGKALYVTHNNGFISVYAHLQKFSPAIEEFVKKQQYKNESYEIELYPSSSSLPLKKGEIIAYSGNTGGSSGPHLHFEIRNSSDTPLNPLFFGMDVKDSQPPFIQSLFAYPISSDSEVNQSNSIVQLNYTQQADGSFLADKIYAFGDLGFGINSYDRQDLAYNKNGLYQVEVLVNGLLYFSYDLEKFTFSESRYINTLIDYEYYKENRQKIQQCFIKPGNNLSIYDNVTNNGILKVEEGLNYNIEIRAKDFKGNTSIIKIPVEGKKQGILTKKEIKITNDFLIASKDNAYKVGKASVFFPANTFYENFYIDLEDHGDTITIHNNKTPVHKNFALSFNASNYTQDDKKQLFIASIDDDGDVSYESTKKNGNTFSTRTRGLGQFTLMKDTIAPKIKPLNFYDGQWLSNYRYLKVKINDDLSGIDNYKAYIDGKWILMEYEYKDRTLTYDFTDLEFEGTKHDLKIIITDNVGNSTTLIASFYRKLLNN